MAINSINLLHWSQQFIWNVTWANHLSMNTRIIKKLFLKYTRCLKWKHYIFLNKQYKIFLSLCFFKKTVIAKNKKIYFVLNVRFDFKWSWTVPNSLIPSYFFKSLNLTILFGAMHLSSWTWSDGRSLTGEEARQTGSEVPSWRFW